MNHPGNHKDKLQHALIETVLAECFDSQDLFFNQM